ncbi:cyanase, partial [Rhodosalinus sediminis]|uniref:cyanase n=1 Tax=Rhodosalinus sediminis TaxID=1940533 RepID=UPI001EFC8AE7
MMTKDDVTMMILSAKKQAGLTWEEIAERIDMSPVWTYSACMGMNGFPEDKAKTLVAALGLPQEAESVLAEPPTKVWEQSVPTDPCIYRFYEIVGVYGPTLKALIEEKFGTGIMSAIDFDMSVTRVPHEKGDRVKVEMSVPRLQRLVTGRRRPGAGSHAEPAHRGGLYRAGRMARRLPELARRSAPPSPMRRR